MAHFLLATASVLVFIKDDDCALLRVSFPENLSDCSREGVIFPAMQLL